MLQKYKVTGERKAKVKYVYKVNFSSRICVLHKML